MDIYKIDSHKLVYHLDRLYDWYKGKDIYPLYIEISPWGGCNQRCIFCALDFLGYKPHFLGIKVLKKFLKDIAGAGVKSIMFAGEGEPLIYKDIAEAITYAKGRGLDVALTTNGVFLNEKFLKEAFSSLSWLRVSFNAPTPRKYSFIHGTKKEDFYRATENIKKAVILKKKKKLSTVLGVQFLLLEENAKDIGKMIKLSKSLGVDYLIIKPYSYHPKSKNYLKVNYKKFLSLGKRISKYEDKKFKIIFRERAILSLVNRRIYKRCLGLSFWAYLSSDGSLYACSSFLGDKRFIYGNIYKESFKKIWRSEKRREIIKTMQDWDTKKCRSACRLEQINNFLWEIKNPPPHKNFI
ncbi:MAG: radical SAM protein [Candidatus Duberdicusella sinuisediminis]|nr:MAG: radical SAM protein [Candidatus Omnitrophota bacterium]